MHKKRKLLGSHKLPQAHEKVCDESERNKQTRKIDACIKIIFMQEALYNAHVKNRTICTSLGETIMDTLKLLFV